SWEQLLADVAREVEVDVRQRRDLLVQEAPEAELVLDRVDVREAGQVADDRADARAAPTAGWEQGPRGVAIAHLHGHLAGELEQIVVKQEEAGEAQRADHAQLLFQARGRLVAVARIARADPRT